MDVSVFYLPFAFPDELWFDIWDYLDIPSKVSCRVVCIKWVNMLDFHLELDLKKMPDRWKFYLLNPLKLPSLGILSLEWLNKRSNIIRNNVEALLRVENRPNFILWILDNFELSTAQRASTLQIYINTSPSLKVVKAFFVKAEEIDLSPFAFVTVCDLLWLGIENYRAVDLLDYIAPETFDVVEYIAQNKPNDINFINLESKLIITACASNNVVGLRKYKDHAKSLDYTVFETALYLAVHQQNTDVLQELTTICASQWNIMREMSSRIGSFVLVPAVLEWLLLQNPNPTRRHELYAKAFKSICTLQGHENLDKDKQIMNRISNLIGDVELRFEHINPGSPYKCSKLFGPLGKWLLERQSFNCGPNIFIFNPISCTGYSYILQSLNLRLAKLILTIPNAQMEWKQYLSLESALAAFYLRESKKVITHFWEMQIIDKEWLTTSTLASSILVRATKLKRVQWLFTGLAIPILESDHWSKRCENFENERRSWKIVKYAYNIGMLISSSPEIITAFFHEACMGSETEGLEWCYNTFDFIKSIKLRKYSILVEPWIKTKLAESQWKSAHVVVDLNAYRKC